MNQIELTETDLEAQLAKRPCGDCFACCVSPGIDSAPDDPIKVRKFPAQACVRLNVDTKPNCCSIYDKRPAACRSFQCAWRGGFLADSDRPDKSGFLLSMYRSEDIDQDGHSGIAMTVTITNDQLADLDFTNPESKIRLIIAQCLMANINDIRFVNYRTKTVLHFLNGEIRHGRLLKSQTPESLEFEVFPKILGRFALGETQPTPVQK